jgi:hypothetical protein
MSLMISQPRIELNGPVNPAAWFDPPVVQFGEESIYRVTLNALEQTVEWPAEITSTPRLEMRSGARGEILRMGGTNLLPLTAFNYHVRASAIGDYIVPQFTVHVHGQPVTVPAARLQVVSTPVAPAQAAPRLLLGVSTTNVFLGQAVRVSVSLPGSPGGGIQSLGQVQFNGQGFIVDQGAGSQRFAPVSRGGANVPAFVHETLITPIAGGKLTLFAQAFTAGMHFSGPITLSPGVTLPAGPPQYTLLESEPIELDARPLPREGELPGFTGAIGTFTVEPPKLATNVLRVGDPVKLTVTVRGSNNLGRLVPPPPAAVRDWQVLAAAADATPPQLVQARGFVSFAYTFIPLTQSAHATPAIPFSCFDPERGAYADLTIPPVPVSVNSNNVAADLSLLLQPGPGATEPEKELRLSGLAASPGWSAFKLVPLQRRAWFPLLQLVPATAFMGLWGWDRRRRFLEQHPDVILRRRARRALHREWRALRRAARAGDAPRFAAAAVNAMRVACAPHYPAEPRALVGSDVIEVLTTPIFAAPRSADFSRLGGTVSPISNRQAADFASAPPDFQTSQADNPAAGPEGTRTTQIANLRDLPRSHHGDHLIPTGANRANELVRRFFEVTDATRFAIAASDASGLLALEPELEQLLERLEAKL